ncbi:CRTAC1 family protein [Aestuariibius sp. 2305UL40-4]|uniref:CRTAC1 family protein n=1 Tax=Aestuariibius violaceus TaxID=3234132 RepID=UPI00345EB264
MRGLALLVFLAGPAAAEVRFEDRSNALPTHVYDGGWEHFVGGGVAVFDCNGDGLPEIFAAGGENPARLFLNRGGFAFEEAPLPELTGVTGAYPLDLDGDGTLDLYVMRAGPNVALKGGWDCGFTDWTASWRLEGGDGWTTAFTAWVEPGDDRPTLAIGNYVDRDDPEGPFGTCDTHRILRPTEMKVYPRDRMAGPVRLQGVWSGTELSPGFCSLSMLAAEDARGRMTLRISNDRHYYVRGGAEQMWDIEEQRFLGPEDGWEGPQLWGMGIASRDLNGDGADEVMLTSMGDQLLQIAEGDGYVAAPFEMGTTAHRPHLGDDGRPSTGWHAEFGDVDNDGRPDLFIAKGNVDQMPGNAMEDPNSLLMQEAGGTFREVAGEAGVAAVARSRGAALADFDGDGRLDLVVVNRRAPMGLWRNVSDAGGFVTVEVVPRRIGGRVELRTATGMQSQQVTVGGGHAGGSALPLHFGIGEAAGAEVRFVSPDGRVGDWREVTAGGQLVLNAGG